MNGFWLSLGVFVVLLFALTNFHLGIKRVRYLRDIPDPTAADPPRVSIIFSALNEAATIEPALRSLLALDYPRLEIIAIDDRSTDDTGAIMDRLALGRPNLRVIHITDLPEGWLGKNHALHMGAQAATGDYLLFTDADVIFDPRALGRAVSYCEHEQLGHLVVFAEFTVKDHLLASLLLNFYALLFTLHPLWKVRTSPSVYVGMGAFNMVLAASYRQAGGHARLRLEIVDDIMLGKLMKQQGFRQDVLLGMKAVSVEWYRNAGELMRGLEKNSFAMCEYSVARLVLSTVAVILVRYWPIVGLFVTSGATWWLNLGSIVVSLLFHLDINRMAQWDKRSFWWWPFSPAIMMFIICRGVALTIRRRGVNWRGTLYALEDLKRARAAMRFRGVEVSVQ